ncbi:unnamed protein product [Lupinus luteus]|uniref:argininosuccinate synthase n=1 Tax=Lupinus luteus TaxID=3873 RepID=A0AAV1Y7Z6_LUPLU
MREWNITRKEYAIEYAKKHNVLVAVTNKTIYSRDWNLWHLSHELMGRDISPASLLVELNEVSGRHEIGRIDMVENRLVGMKSRGVYETPGGTILFTIERELKSLALDRETIQVKDSFALKYAKLGYVGRWFEPLRESMDEFM